MNLNKKKKLIARMLNLGVKRIVIDSSRSNEIKEAITREDMRELIREGAITIREMGGRRHRKRKRWKRGEGKIKKRAGQRKRAYIKITRKLRKYLSDSSEKEKISHEKYRDLRKQIKAKAFKNLESLREAIK
ncbi:hypothetical protein HZB88_01340 [archaeon]|nr:hypothetical protein [archaeon]